MSPQQPIFFTPNRVWRCYTGGVLLDRFVGNDKEEDGHLPEDWIASTVVAMNGERSQGPDEGLARARDGKLFRDVLASDPVAYLGKGATKGELSILCKFLDAAVRLPIQCHPDIPFAKQHFNSDHGKTEAWIILDTRVIDGVEPYLLMGFKPGITPEAFAKAVETQDIATMESMLHRIPARAGDLWFIPGRFPHAIGPGVFMVEIQEPSDWVVQPEAKCADTCLTHTDMWGPLTPEIGLQCFEYEGMTEEEVRAKCLQVSSKHDPMGPYSTIIGAHYTDCFSVGRMDVREVVPQFCMDKPYRIELVTEGVGELVINGVTTTIKKGDVYFLPNGVREVAYHATKRMKIYLLMP